MIPTDAGIGSVICADPTNDANIPGERLSATTILEFYSGNSHQFGVVSGAYVNCEQWTALYAVLNDGASYATALQCDCFALGNGDARRPRFRSSGQRYDVAIYCVIDFSLHVAACAVS